MLTSSQGASRMRSGVYIYICLSQWTYYNIFEGLLYKLMYKFVDLELTFFE